MKKYKNLIFGILLFLLVIFANVGAQLQNGLEFYDAFLSGLGYSLPIILFSYFGSYFIFKHYGKIGEKEKKEVKVKEEKKPVHYEKLDKNMVWYLTIITFLILGSFACLIVMANENPYLSILLMSLCGAIMCVVLGLYITSLIILFKKRKRVE